MRKTWMISVVLVLLAGFLLGGSLVAENTGTPLLSGLLGTETTEKASSTVPINTASAIASLPMGVADIAEKAGPAVVNIEARIKVSTGMSDPFMNDPFFRQFFGGNLPTFPQSRYEKGIGTGFIISSDGYIVTNQHVVNNAEEVMVKLTEREKSIPAKVVGQDYELDLAVLKIEGENYPTIPMGDSDKMRVGDWVVAIGQPYGLDHTVTTGVVSAKGRPITIEDRNYKNLIQTDAAINPGNSGGPLLNMAGQVIAINTAVNAQAQGIGFAIPINTAKNVLTELMNGQKVIRPYMGIRMVDLDEQICSELGLPANTRGAVVVEVVAGSPAARGGLQSLDVIQKLDSTEITSATGVQSFIEQKKVGDKLKIQVLRQGKNITLNVTLIAKP
ncbi:MAG: trypsin-like peptidase domain-containing protein [Syntrophomonadaceae bacterium]|jgi:serine protease Do